MRVCVIADRESWARGFAGPVLAAGQDRRRRTSPSPRPETDLVRARPDLVVPPRDRSREDGAATVSRAPRPDPGPPARRRAGLRAPGRPGRSVRRRGRLRGRGRPSRPSWARPCTPAGRRGHRPSPGGSSPCSPRSGGSGASLVAANLAVAMAKPRSGASLVDLKTRSGDLAAHARPQALAHDAGPLPGRRRGSTAILFEQTLSKLRLGGEPARLAPELRRDALGARRISPRLRPRPRPVPPHRRRRRPRSARRDDRGPALGRRDPSGPAPGIQLAAQCQDDARPPGASGVDPRKILLVAQPRGPAQGDPGREGRGVLDPQVLREAPRRPEGGASARRTTACPR